MRPLSIQKRLPNYFLRSLAVYFVEKSYFVLDWKLTFFSCSLVLRLHITLMKVSWSYLTDFASVQKFPKSVSSFLLLRLEIKWLKISLLFKSDESFKTRRYIICLVWCCSLELWLYGWCWKTVVTRRKKMNILLKFENRVFCNLSKPFRFSCVPSKGCSNFISHSRCSSNSSVTSELLVKPTVFSLIVRRLPASVSLITRSAYRSVFDIDTNVKKDVLLYEHDSTFFYALNFVLIGQLILFYTFAYLFVKAIRVLPNEELKQTRFLDLSQKKWQILIPSTFVFAGKLISL